MRDEHHFSFVDDWVRVVNSLLSPSLSLSLHLLFLNWTSVVFDMCSVVHKYNLSRGAISQANTKRPLDRAAARPDKAFGSIVFRCRRITMRDWN